MKFATNALWTYLIFPPFSALSHSMYNTTCRGTLGFSPQNFGSLHEGATSTGSLLYTGNFTSNLKLQDFLRECFFYWCRCMGQLIFDRKRQPGGAKLSSVLKINVGQILLIRNIFKILKVNPFVNSELRIVSGIVIGCFN